MNVENQQKLIDLKEDLLFYGFCVELAIRNRAPADASYNREEIDKSHDRIVAKVETLLNENEELHLQLDKLKSGTVVSPKEARQHLREAVELVLRAKMERELQEIVGTIYGLPERAVTQNDYSWEDA